MSSEEQASRPSFNQNLENARVLIEESPWRDNPEKYLKVAEGILRRILSVDPGNLSAKRLLAKTVATVPPAKVQAAAPPAMVQAAGPPAKVQAAAPPAKAQAAMPLANVRPPLPQPARPSRPVQPLDQSFVVQTIVPQVKKVKKKEATKSPWGLVGFAAVVAAIVGILMFVMGPNALTSEYAPKSPTALPAIAPASAEMTGNDVAFFEHSIVAPTPTASSSMIPDPVPDLEAAAPQTPETEETPESIPVKSKVPPVAIQTGTLAVSSPTTVDIYMGDKLVGSAPTTLVLPAGNQTLEYRHQDMRKVMTHVIKANETTTTMVTFEVPLQINARPWAQVFLDGPERQPLGQTPLSEVRVPIGSVLIFENPNFAGKNYRVTGRETEIRMTFP